MKKGGCVALVTILSIVLLFTTGPVMADSKNITAAIDEASKSCRGVSQQIWEFKETGSQELKSSALLKEEIAKLGYKVTGDLKVPDDLVKDGIAKTAFKAEMAGKGPGPTVTIMLEYDALAIGHACGHNLIATSGLMAAAGLAKVMKDPPAGFSSSAPLTRSAGPWAQAKWHCSKAGISKARTSCSSPMRQTAGAWTNVCWR